MVRFFKKAGAAPFAIVEAVAIKLAAFVAILAVAWLVVGSSYVGGWDTSVPFFGWLPDLPSHGYVKQIKIEGTNETAPRKMTAQMSGMWWLILPLLLWQVGGAVKAVRLYVFGDDKPEAGAGIATLIDREVKARDKAIKAAVDPLAERLAQLEEQAAVLKQFLGSSESEDGAAKSSRGSEDRREPTLDLSKLPSGGKGNQPPPVPAPASSEASAKPASDVRLDPDVAKALAIINGASDKAKATATEEAKKAPSLAEVEAYVKTQEVVGLTGIQEKFPQMVGRESQVFSMFKALEDKGIVGPAQKGKPRQVLQRVQPADVKPEAAPKPEVATTAKAGKGETELDLGAALAATSDNNGSDEASAPDVPAADGTDSEPAAAESEVAPDVEQPAVTATETGPKPESEEVTKGRSDPLYEVATTHVLESRNSSIGALCAALELSGDGKSRVRAMLAAMEADCIVGPKRGKKPREILLTEQQYADRQTGEQVRKEFAPFDRPRSRDKEKDNDHGMEM